MQRAMNTAMILAVVLTVGGCGEVLKTRSIEIGGLIIRNQTGGPLYDIKLKVERTGTVVACNFIPVGKSFSTGFPLRRYQGNSVRGSWRQNGNNFATRDLYAEIPEVLDISAPAMAVFEIHPAGTANILLEQ
jgi:hypothetical protein